MKKYDCIYFDDRPQSLNVQIIHYAIVRRAHCKALLWESQFSPSTTDGVTVFDTDIGPMLRLVGKLFLLFDNRWHYDVYDILSVRKYVVKQKPNFSQVTVQENMKNTIMYLKKMSR